MKKASDSPEAGWRSLDEEDAGVEDLRTFEQLVMLYRDFGFNTMIPDTQARIQELRRSLDPHEEKRV